MPKSIPPAERFARFVVIPEDPDDCWGWSGPTHYSGYGLIAAGDKSRRKFRAHRVSYEIHVGPIPAGLFVCHHCDRPACSNPRHLFLGTHTDNMRDMFAKGRGNVCVPHPSVRGDRNGSRLYPERLVRGEQNQNAKLTADLVREIRARYAAGGVSTTRLATEYGVSAGAIWQIVRRRTWAHID